MHVDKQNFVAQIGVIPSRGVLSDWSYFYMYMYGMKASDLGNILGYGYGIPVR